MKYYNSDMIKFDSIFLRTELPELQKVGEYATSYSQAQKKHPFMSTKNSLSGILPKGMTSSVIRSMGNIDRRKDTRNFDKIALISDDDDNDYEDNLVGIDPQPLRKLKNKKKSKHSTTKKTSDSTLGGKVFLRNEFEKLDGFKPSDTIDPQADLMDPKEGVLHNLKKKHGILKIPSNQAPTEANNVLENSTIQTAKGVKKDTLSKARILQNLKMNESRVIY